MRKVAIPLPVAADLICALAWQELALRAGRHCSSPIREASKKARPRGR